MDIADKKALLLASQRNDEEKVRRLQERIRERQRKIEELSNAEVKFIMNECNMTPEQLIALIRANKTANTIPASAVVSSQPNSFSNEPLDERPAV